MSSVAGQITICKILRDKSLSHTFVQTFEIYLHYIYFQFNCSFFCLFVDTLDFSRTMFIYLYSQFAQFTFVRLTFFFIFRSFRFLFIRWRVNQTSMPNRGKLSQGNRCRSRNRIARLQDRWNNILVDWQVDPTEWNW